MLSATAVGCSTVNLAARVDEPASGTCLVVSGAVIVRFGLEGVEDVAASIALVTSGAEIVADGAFTLDETVGKEGVVRFEAAVGLNGLTLLDETVLQKLAEDILNDIGLVLGRGAAEDVEIDSEPVVDGLVKSVVLVAEGLRVYSLLEGLGLGGSAVLVLLWLVRGELVLEVGQHTEPQM